jgi:hypothetical protein
VRGEEGGELREGGRRARTRCLFLLLLLLVFLLLVFLLLVFLLCPLLLLLLLLLLLGGQLGSEGTEAFFRLLDVVDELLDLHHLVLTQGAVLGEGGREGGREGGKMSACLGSCRS